MLTSVAEHCELIGAGAADVIQPDAPRIGGITQFLKLAALAEHQHLQLAPHFAMEIHLHLAAAYPHEPWVEHFDWLDPLFNERLEISDGRMHLLRRGPAWASPSANRPAPGHVSGARSTHGPDRPHRSNHLRQTAHHGRAEM